MMSFEFLSKRHSLAFQILISFFVFLFLLSNQAEARVKSVKYDSPLEIEIKLIKDIFRVGEPVVGQVLIKNKYPSAMSAVFLIKLYLNNKLFSEQTMAIKKVPMGTMKFSLKEFGVPNFNSHPGAEGVWRIYIVQMNMDKSYAKEVKVSIVPPAVKKELEKKLRIKKMF